MHGPLSWRHHVRQFEEHRVQKDYSLPQHHILHIMARSSPSASRMLAILLLAALVLPSQALYFYIDGEVPKCFFEELPKDTLVVGKSSSLI